MVKTVAAAVKAPKATTYLAPFPLIPPPIYISPPPQAYLYY